VTVQQAALPWLAPLVAQAQGLASAHAVLLHGAAGDGLFEGAQSLAKAWLCESTEAGRGRPCGICPACRLVDTDSHPDLLRVLPEELRQQLGLGQPAQTDAADGESKTRRKPSRQIRIAEIRQMIDWIVTTNSRGQLKVAFIHPAEAMNQQSASALLKTLEEPPRGARLLLACSEPERLLPTVRSRCQVLRLPTPSAADASQWLQAQGLAQPEVLLAACSHRPLDALAMHAAGIDAARWVALPAAVLRRQTAAFTGWGVGRVVDAMQKLCHDGLALSLGAGPLFFPSQALSRPVSAARLAAWSRELNALVRRIDHPWNEGLLIESVVLSAHAAWTGKPDGSDTLAA
jgi:DNA polymerase III subunit delta'